MIFDSHFHITSMLDRGLDATLPSSFLGLECGTEPGDAKERIMAVGKRKDVMLSMGAGPWMLEKEADIDAIICGSDQVARGALDTLRDLGRRVPEDVAVTGHDNWKILVSGSRPPLTSIDMNLEDLGRRGATRLREAIEGSPAPGVEKLACRLVVRGSTVG